MLMQLQHHDATPECNSGVQHHVDEQHLQLLHPRYQVWAGTVVYMYVFMYVIMYMHSSSSTLSYFTSIKISWCQVDLSVFIFSRFRCFIFTIITYCI